MSTADGIVDLHGVGVMEMHMREANRLAWAVAGGLTPLEEVRLGSLYHLLSKKAVGGFRPSNWYTDKTGLEFMCLGVYANPDTGTWSATLCLSDGMGDVIWTSNVPYWVNECRVKPVDLVKSYDQEDMCIRCGIVHLTLQNPPVSDSCEREREVRLREDHQYA